MERSVPVPVRLIGGLHILGGGLTVVAALLLALAAVCTMIFGGGGGGGWVRLGGSDLEWGALFLGIALLAGLVGAFQAACGVGLCRGRPWARVMVVGFALLSTFAAFGQDETWPAAIVPLAIAGYLCFNGNVQRAFR